MWQSLLKNHSINDIPIITVITIHSNALVSSNAIYSSPMTLLAESFIQSTVASMIHHLDEIFTKNIYSLLLNQFISGNKRLNRHAVVIRNLRHHDYMNGLEWQWPFYVFRQRHARQLPIQRYSCQSQKDTCLLQYVKQHLLLVQSYSYYHAIRCFAIRGVCSTSLRILDRLKLGRISNHVKQEMQRWHLIVLRLSPLYSRESSLYE